MKVEFLDFGLYNPTIVIFHISEDEEITLTIKNSSVEKISEEIHNVLYMLGCMNADFVTSSEKLKLITRQDESFMKNVWTLFYENDIYIREDSTK